MHLQRLKLLSPTEGMHLQEDTSFDLDIGVKDTRNVARYPLHHETYAPTTFEVQQFRRGCIYKKIHYVTFDRDLGINVT